MWLTGDRARQRVFADGLRGYPDNLALGSDGLVCVALASPRVAELGVDPVPVSPGMVQPEGFRLRSVWAVS